MYNRPDYCKESLSWIGNPYYFTASWFCVLTFVWAFVWNFHYTLRCVFISYCQLGPFNIAFIVSNYYCLKLVCWTMFIQIINMPLHDKTHFHAILFTVHRLKSISILTSNEDSPADLPNTNLHNFGNSWKERSYREEAYGLVGIEIFSPEPVRHIAVYNSVYLGVGLREFEAYDTCLCGKNWWIYLIYFNCYIHAYICIYRHIYIHTHRHMYIPTCTYYTYMHTCAYPYIHTPKYSHIHIHTWCTVTLTATTLKLIITNKTISSYAVCVWLIVAGMNGPLTTFYLHTARVDRLTLGWFWNRDFYPVECANRHYTVWHHHTFFFILLAPILMYHAIVSVPLNRPTDVCIITV